MSNSATGHLMLQSMTPLYNRAEHFRHLYLAVPVVVVLSLYAYHLSFFERLEFATRPGMVHDILDNYWLDIEANLHMNCIDINVDMEELTYLECRSYKSHIRPSYPHFHHQCSPVPEMETQNSIVTHSVHGILADQFTLLLHLFSIP